MLGMPKATETSDFWRRLTEMIREDVSVKQQTVAKLFHVGQSAVTKWKTGKDTPSLPRAVEMADRYGVCVEWLLTGRGPKHPGGTADADLSRLLEFWDGLRPATKHDVVSYAVYRGTLQAPELPPSKDADETSTNAPKKPCKLPPRRTDHS